jgi:hypothetical protein
LRSSSVTAAGKTGSDRAFKAACFVGPGFDLDPGVLLRILLDDYTPRCRPP